MGLKNPMSDTFVEDFLVLFIPNGYINKEKHNKDKSKDFLIPNILQFQQKIYNNTFFRASLYFTRNFSHKEYFDSHSLFDIFVINITNFNKDDKNKVLDDSELNTIKRKNPDEIKAFLISFCNGINLQSENFTRRKITEANIFLKKNINKNLRIDENFNLKLLARKRFISFLNNICNKNNINEKYFTGIVFPFVKIAMLAYLREKIILDPDTASKIHESSFNSRFERFIYRWVSKRSKRRFITFILAAIAIFFLSIVLFKIISYLVFTIYLVCKVYDFFLLNYIWKPIFHFHIVQKSGHIFWQSISNVPIIRIVLSYIQRQTIHINEMVQQSYYAFQQFCKANSLDGGIVCNTGFKYLLSVIIVLIPIFYVYRFINSFKKDELKMIDKILFCKSDEIYKSSRYRDIARAIYIMKPEKDIKKFEKDLEKSEKDKDSDYKETWVWAPLKEAMKYYQENLNQKIFGKISLKDKTKEKFLQAFIERYITGEEDSFLYISRRL